MRKKSHKQIKFEGPLFFKPIKNHFQALFKDICQFASQIEKSSTFQYKSQIQALFKFCGNHGLAVIITRNYHAT